MHEGADSWDVGAMNQRKVSVVVVVLVAAAVALFLLRSPGSTNPSTSAEKPSPEGQDAGGSSVKATAKATALAPQPVKVTEVATPANEVAHFGWGSGEGQLGRNRPDEANPEAPMSLTVDAAGNTWILDQVNDRLVKLDRAGKTVATVKLSQQAAQDVTVTPDGKVLVLDRLVDRSVAVLGPDGKPLGELPLGGKGMDDTGGATGVFSQGDSIYVEREHGDSIRVGSTNGENDAERLEVPGRPAQDGRTYLTAGIVDSPRGLVMVTAIEAPSKQHRFTRQLVMGVPVLALNALDTDRSGVIYLGTLVEQAGSTPEAPKFGITLLCLDPLDGRVIGQAQWAANTGAEETFRELAVQPEGGVLFLERTEQGSRVVRYGCGG